RIRSMPTCMSGLGSFGKGRPSFAQMSWSFCSRSMCWLMITWAACLTASLLERSSAHWDVVISRRLVSSTRLSSFLSTALIGPNCVWVSVPSDSAGAGFDVAAGATLPGWPAGATRGADCVFGAHPATSRLAATAAVSRRVVDVMVRTSLVGTLAPRLPHGPSLCLVQQELYERLISHTHS